MASTCTSPTSCGDDNAAQSPSYNDATELPSRVKNIVNHRHSTSPSPSIKYYDSLPTSFHSRHSSGPEVTRGSTEELKTVVDDYFNKRFQFHPDDDWVLPDPSAMFSTSKWNIPQLQVMKINLNKVKNKLNDYNLDDWHRHTRSMNQAGEILWRLRKEYEPEFLTQAWCKLYENLATFPLVQTPLVKRTKFFNSVHLCEAPGAFVTALNHFLKLKHTDLSWRWMATTLNPYYEGNPLSCMINDDRFILQTLPHWNFGLDYTGNLMDPKNMNHLVQESESMGTVSLVTADGSIDCQEDPGEQETVVAALHFCEAITALRLLTKGGNFLLKMFTLYECDTVCLVYLLCCSFKSVVVNKPVTSKEGNSEVYVVCMNYQGYDTMKPWLQVLEQHFGPERPDEAMFPLGDIPITFRRQVEECAAKFKRYQVDVIERNIRAFHGKDQHKRSTVRRLRYLTAERFLEVYDVRPLQEEDEVVGKKILRETSTLNMDPRTEEGSFNDRRRRSSMLPLDLLRAVKSDVEHMNISWPYDEDEVKWLTFPEIDRNFEIITGKPVTVVNSSKFCLGRLLKIRNQVKELASKHFPSDESQSPKRKSVDTLHYSNGVIQHPFDPSVTGDVGNMDGDSDSPSTTAIVRKSLEYMFPGAKYLDFKAHLWSSMESGSNQESEVNAFQDIMEEVEILWRDDTLILLGYPMLTQFNVGMVYMLSHLFGKVGFTKPVKQDFAVVFRNFRHWNFKMRAFLEEVEKTILTLRSGPEKRNVLAVLPVNLICANSSADRRSSSSSSVASGDGPREFYTCVTETNHLCVKEQTLDIIDNILRSHRPMTRDTD